MDTDIRTRGTRVDYYPPRLTPNAMRYLYAVASHDSNARVSPALCRWIIAQINLESARRDVEDLAHESLLPPEATLPRLPLVVWSDREIAAALRLVHVLVAVARDGDPTAEAFLRAVERPIVISAAGRLDRSDRPGRLDHDMVALEVEARTLALRHALDDA